MRVWFTMVEKIIPHDCIRKVQIDAVERQCGGCNFSVI